MKTLFVSIVLFVLMCANNALAGPDESIVTTYDNDGQLQLDLRLGSIRQSEQPRLSAATLGLGYGLTKQWFSEVYISYNRTGGESTNFDAISWQNTFLLTHGQLPVDISLYTEIESPKDRSEGYEITFGPLLQTEFGRTKLNANLFFQRNYRVDFYNPMLLNYQWQLKQSLKPAFELGMQGFGEMGQWDHWASRSEQSHRMGPAIFGEITLIGKQVIKYNAAILIDVNDEKHSTTLRTQFVCQF